MKKFDEDLHEEQGWDDYEPAAFPEDDIYNATDLPRGTPIKIGLRMALSMYGPVLSRSTADKVTA